jgi:hypothetical protein
MGKSRSQAFHDCTSESLIQDYPLVFLVSLALRHLEFLLDLQALKIFLATMPATMLIIPNPTTRLNASDVDFGFSALLT